MGLIRSLLASIACLLALTSVAAADCDDIRKAILRMDAESAKPPGYFVLRDSLVSAGINCRNYPAREPEYWFRSNGTPTGQRSDQGERPMDAAYAATPAVGAACAGSGNPSMCALMTGTATACRTPRDEQHQQMCLLLIGRDGTGLTPDLTKWSGIPPLTLTLDGNAFTLPDGCHVLMKNLIDFPQALSSAKDTATMQRECPDFLAALERRMGTNPRQNPGGFWPAFADLAINNFPPAGAPVPSVAGIAANADFRRMCNQAATFENECRRRQANMMTAGQQRQSFAGGPPESQAGAFQECASAYAGVSKMCERTMAFAAIPKGAPPPPARLRTVPTPSPAAEQPAPAPAVAPPAAAAPAANPAARMSPECQAQLNRLFEGADTGDNAKAASGYGALRGANCDAQIRELANTAHTGLPERKLSSRLGGMASRAMNRDPNEAIYNGPAVGSGGGGGGDGYDPGEVIDFAIAIFGLAGNIAGAARGGGGGFAYVPRAGGNFSTLNGRARSTYGQGAPTTVAPPQGPSCITDKSGRHC